MKEPYWLLRAKAFRYAIKGLKYFFKEAHPRIQLIISILVLILAYLFELNIFEWISILFCIALVLSTEAVNSALEHLTNLVSPSWNEQAGMVKDLAAGAVLISSIISVIIGLIIFFPKIYSLLSL